MSNSSAPANIIVMEAYDDGSHADFLNGLIKHSRHNYVRLSMPGRKWKWRMRGSAIYFAQELHNIWPANATFSTEQADLIFTSDMTSVTDLKALLPKSLQKLPVVCYFHENQLTYPLSQHDKIDYQYGFTNITSALASDGLWFNSEHNRSEFISAADSLLKKMPDFVPPDIGNTIKEKSIIMPLGMPPELFDNNNTRNNNNPPVILWNHRWEYDKNPEVFFETLYKLDQSNIDYKLIIAGQSFRTSPAVFNEAKDKLSHRIIHFGFAESRAKYIELLNQSNIVISTAIHEFFGIAVMEAVSNGCTPLLPNRLNYPYLVPEQYHNDLLYNIDAELFNKLVSLLKQQNRHEAFPRIHKWAHQLKWDILAEQYDKNFSNFI